MHFIRLADIWQIFARRIRVQNICHTDICHLFVWQIIFPLRRPSAKPNADGLSSALRRSALQATACPAKMMSALKTSLPDDDNLSAARRLHLRRPTVSAPRRRGDRRRRHHGLRGGLLSDAARAVGGRARQVAHCRPAVVASVGFRAPAGPRIGGSSADDGAFRCGPASSANWISIWSGVRAVASMSPPTRTTGPRSSNGWTWRGSTGSTRARSIASRSTRW